MIGITVIEICYLLLGLAAFAAWWDKFLTVRQMLERGFPAGIPFVHHHGITGDVLVVSPLIATLSQWYGGQWTMFEIAIALHIAAVVSIALHIMYVRGSATSTALPEALTYDGNLTIAGAIHAIFMAGAFTVVLLFYFCTTGVAASVAIGVSIAFAAHAVYGSHVLLSLLQYDWYPKKSYNEMGTWVSIGAAWVILTAGCWRLIQNG